MDTEMIPVSEHMPPDGGVAIEKEDPIGSLKKAVPDSCKRATTKKQTVGQFAPVVRKDIPPKKDRMDPLKIDMSKPIAIPLSSTQLSLQCLECHIIFSDHKSKERHLKHSHPAEYEQRMLGDALFTCYVCDRHFTCSSDLMAHQRTHTEKQPFKCPICSESFSRSSELTFHKKVHFSLHGYTCSDCGKPCKTLTLLKYHLRTHTGEKPYVCKECGKRFSLSKTLQKHRFIHSQDETEEAGRSPLPSTVRHNVNSGASAAQGKPTVTYSCSLCDGTFKSAKTRHQHMKLKHAQCKATTDSSAVADGWKQSEGQVTEAEVQQCDPVLTLENMVTFEQGQALQEIETLGQEQMQQLIETLGQEQAVRQVEMVVPEELRGETEQGQKCAFELELTEQQVVVVVEEERGRSKELEVEQSEEQTQTAVQEHTQLQIQTLVVMGPADVQEVLQLEQTNEQIKSVETEDQFVQVDRMEQTEERGQNEELGRASGQAEEVEQRRTETVQLDQTDGQTETVELEQIPQPPNEDSITQKEKAEEEAQPRREEERNELSCNGVEEGAQLSETVQTIQEETQAQMEQQKQNNHTTYEINEPEQNNFQGSEQYSELLQHTDNTELLPLLTGITDQENGIEPVKEEQKIPQKSALLVGQPVNHSQLLHPEKGFPQRKLQDKHLTQQPEMQSKGKRGKPSKKGKLVEFAPKKERKAKQKPVKMCEVQEEEIQKQHHKKAQMQARSLPVKKTELKQRRGKEKAIKKQETVKRALMQEQVLDLPQTTQRVIEQVLHMQSKKRLKEMKKNVPEKQAKQTKGKVQILEVNKRNRGQIPRVQLKNKEQMLPKKQRKVKEKSVENSRDVKRIEQQSLLLLKGHKQPQVKVHKLDSSTRKEAVQPPRNQSLTSAPQQNRKTVQRLKRKNLNSEPQQEPKKPRQKRKTEPKQDQKVDELLTPLQDLSSFSARLLTNSRTLRKRKASTSGIFEKGPSVVRRRLRCERCGEAFSGIGTLQKHVAAFCSLTGPCQHNAAVKSIDVTKSADELKAILPSTQSSRKTSVQVQDMSSMNGNVMGKIQALSNQGGEGVKVVGVAVSGADLCLTLNLDQTPRPIKSVLRNAIRRDNYEIQAATDWDMEVEMGEIGLGDRVERVSFPALNPSPSLPHPPSCLEGEGQGDEESEQLNVVGDISTPTSSSNLDTSESGRSQVLRKQPTEEIVAINNGVMGFVDESRQGEGTSQIARVECHIHSEDAHPSVSTSDVISPNVLKTSQVKILELQDHCEDPSSSKEAKLKNVQQTVTNNRDMQINGKDIIDEQNLEHQKNIKETSNTIHLVTSSADLQSVVDEEIKEEVLLDVNLVTVGDESVESPLCMKNSIVGLAGSSQTTHISTASVKPSQLKENVPGVAQNSMSPELSVATMVSVGEFAVGVPCATDYPEVKQEEVEVEVQMKERRTMRGVRSNSGIQTEGEMKKIRDDGMKDMEVETENDGCQVVLEVHSLTNDDQIKEEQHMDFCRPSQSSSHEVCTAQTVVGAGCAQEEPVMPASLAGSHLPASLEESSDERLVFELDSVTTSVEVLKAEGGLEEGRGPRSRQSPCVLLERFLRGREKDGTDLETCQVEMRNNDRAISTTAMGFQMDGSQGRNANEIILMETLRGQVIKVEGYSSESCTRTSSARKRSPVAAQKQCGVQMILVKEEDSSLAANEPQSFTQHQCTELVMEDMTNDGNTCLDATSHGNREQGLDMEREGATSVILNAGDDGEQCIFLQVKEEEREVEVAPSQSEPGISVLVVSGGTRLDEQTDTCQNETGNQRVSALYSGPFSSAGGFWVSVAPNCGTEQEVSGMEECLDNRQTLTRTDTQTMVHSAQEMTHFLLQNSDGEDTELRSSDSELEEEDFVMACYQESQRDITSSDNPSRQLDYMGNNLSAQNEHAGKIQMRDGAGREMEQTPIDYFAQYLDWDTWEELVSCNICWPDSPEKLTAKEVAQFVGIHIAMGTLKFPDLKLYWQDLTRVPLIADAMPASRFFQLACKLRIGRRTRETNTPGEGDPTNASKNGSSGSACGMQSCGETCVERIEKPFNTKDNRVHASQSASSANSPEIICSFSNSDPLPQSFISTNRLGDTVKGHKPVLMQRCDLTSDTEPSPFHQTATVEPGHEPTAHGTDKIQRQMRQMQVLSDNSLEVKSKIATPVPHEQKAENTRLSEDIKNRAADPLWRVRALIERVRAGCLSLSREGHYGVDEYPIYLGRPIRKKSSSNARPTLNCAVLIGTGGLILDFNLNVDDFNKEDVMAKMVPMTKVSGERTVFICKEELSTPAVMERLLLAGVRSAARVEGLRGGTGDEFVSSDGKLTLFRSQQGFILSTLRKRQPCPVSVVEDFEGAQKLVQLNREMLNLYRTPLSASSPVCWPQSVLWHLTDMALVNAWLKYRLDHRQLRDPMKLMTFRLEVAKALILSDGSNSPSSTPPPHPAPEPPSQDQAPIPSPGPYPTAATPDAAFRYDGLAHWPEQLCEGEGGRCRFGGCSRTSRVRCLKCCVFLCISQNSNCFLKFHCKGGV